MTPLEKYATKKKLTVKLANRLTDPRKAGPLPWGSVGAKKSFVPPAPMRPRHGQPKLNRLSGGPAPKGPAAHVAANPVRMGSLNPGSSSRTRQLRNALKPAERLAGNSNPYGAPGIGQVISGLNRNKAMTSKALKLGDKSIHDYRPRTTLRENDTPRLQRIKSGPGRIRYSHTPSQGQVYDRNGDDCPQLAPYAVHDPFSQLN